MFSPLPRKGDHETEIGKSLIPALRPKPTAFTVETSPENFNLERVSELVGKELGCGDLEVMKSYGTGMVTDSYLVRAGERLLNAKLLCAGLVEHNELAPDGDLGILEHDYLSTAANFSFLPVYAGKVEDGKGRILAIFTEYEPGGESLVSVVKNHRLSNELLLEALEQFHDEIISHTRDNGVPRYPWDAHPSDVKFFLDDEAGKTTLSKIMITDTNCLATTPHPDDDAAAWAKNVLGQLSASRFSSPS